MNILRQLSLSERNDMRRKVISASLLGASYRDDHMAITAIRAGFDIRIDDDLTAIDVRGCNLVTTFY